MSTPLTARMRSPTLSRPHRSAGLPSMMRPEQDKDCSHKIRAQAFLHHVNFILTELYKKSWHGECLLIIKMDN